MGVFVGHEACPKCGSKDNLARYDDGGAWCFGCHHREPPTHYVSTPPPEYSEKPKITPPPDLGTEPLPNVNREWLLQYIKDKEIDDYFMYSPSRRRHYFCHSSDGDVYFEGRSVTIGNDGEFSSESPKTISYGTKPKLLLGKWAQTNKLVLVEDIVSAIKVARHAGAMPLFGSHLSAEWMIWITKIPQIHEVILWLDCDKYAQSMKLAHKMAKLRLTRVISTDLDPKQVPDEEIRELLEVY